MVLDSFQQNLILLHLGKSWQQQSLKMVKLKPPVAQSLTRYSDCLADRNLYFRNRNVSY